MAITYEEKVATFASVIYEDDVVTFRDFLQTNAGEEITMNFQDCDDIHLAVLQLVMAYKKNYSCIYEFNEKDTLYARVLKGFDLSEDHCN